MRRTHADELGENSNENSNDNKEFGRIRQGIRKPIVGDVVVERVTLDRGRHNSGSGRGFGNDLGLY